MLYTAKVKSKGIYLDVYISTHHPDSSKAIPVEIDSIQHDSLRTILGLNPVASISPNRVHAIYNEFALKHRWTTSRVLAPTTIKQIQRALKVIPDEEGWRGAFEFMSRDKWFSGKGEYKPTINSIFRDSRYIQFHDKYLDSMEGKGAAQEKSVEDILAGFTQTLNEIKPWNGTQS